MRNIYIKNKMKRLKPPWSVFLAVESRRTAGDHPERIRRGSRPNRGDRIARVCRRCSKSLLHLHPCHIRLALPKEIQRQATSRKLTAAEHHGRHPTWRVRCRWERENLHKCDQLDEPSSMFCQRLLSKSDCRLRMFDDCSSSKSGNWSVNLLLLDVKATKHRLWKLFFFFDIHWLIIFIRGRCTGGLIFASRNDLLTRQRMRNQLQQ